MNAVVTLWKYARPHTIIGTTASVTALYIIATSQAVLWPASFWLTLTSAVACNIFITGYNQLVDVKLDKINKPDLPLASGELSRLSGAIIVWSALILSLSLAFYLSSFLFILVLLISIIGFLYSWKRVYLKRHHQPAAIAITVVRGFLINAGFYLYFFGHGVDRALISNPIWMLIIFVSLFSIGISWFKDIPDMKGDKTQKVASLALTIGSKNAFNKGVLVVTIGYILSAICPLFFQMEGLNEAVLIFGNILAGFIFLRIVSQVNIENHKSIQRFYLTFWGLFVLEYILFALAAVV